MRIYKRICSIIALAMMALALSCTPVLAQGDPQGPPPPPDQGAGPDGGGPGMHGRGMDGRGMDGRMGPDGRDGRGGPGGPGGHGEWMRGREEFRGRGGDFGGGGPMGMHGGDFILERFLRDPDIRKQAGITDDQVAKIRQQESEFRKAEIRNRADLEVKRIDLKDLLESDKPDRAAIDNKLQEISASQMALEKAAIDHRLDLRDAITPAQREKIRQLLKDRWQRGGPGDRGPEGAGRRGPRGAGGPNAQGQGRRSNGAGNSSGNGAGNGAPPPPPNNQ
jgi:Spy/CpxP family protein refolding chaperone